MLIYVNLSIILTLFNNDSLKIRFSSGRGTIGNWDSPLSFDLSSTLRSKLHTTHNMYAFEIRDRDRSELSKDYLLLRSIVHCTSKRGGETPRGIAISRREILR